MDNVAGYARLSQATEESVSVASQVRMIQAEAKRRGWPDPVIFTDEGVSGSKDVARPARDDLERRIASGEFDALMVKSVDRLARSVLDFFRIADTAAKANCAIIVIEAGLDTSTPIGKMILGILAQFAEFEAATIGQRVTLSNVARRREGRALGGPVPYGLRNVQREDRPGTFREADPEEAVVVLRMVDELLAGHSLRAIAAGLTRDGIPTPRREDGANWIYTGVRRVLANPAIAGMTRSLGDVIRDEDGLARVQDDAAIIDAETFRRVQTVLTARGSDIRRTPTGDRLLLDGLAFCASCGGYLRRAATRGTRTAGEPFVSYACSNAAKGRCTAPVTMSTRVLDAYVVEEFLAAMGDQPRTRLEATEDGRVSGRLAEIRAEITDTAAAFATAPPADIPALAERMTTLRAAESRALAEAEAAPIFAVIATGQTWRETWEDTEDRAGRRALLAEAIDRVIVRRPARRGGHVPASERAVVLWGGEPV